VQHRNHATHGIGARIGGKAHISTHGAALRRGLKTRLTARITHNLTMPGSPQLRALLAAIITVVIWTTFIVYARAAAHKTLTPFDITFARILGAAVLIVPWGVWLVRKAKRENPQAQSWLGVSPLSFSLTALLGFFGALLYPVIAYSGFFFAPAAHAAVLMPGFLPLWTALLALFILNTPIPSRRRMGLALIVCGGLLVGGGSLLRAFEGGRVWLGDVLFLSGSFCWAIYTVNMRKSAVPAIEATIAITFFALLTFVPVYGLLAWSGVVQSKLAIAPWREILEQAFMQGVLSVVVSGITFLMMVNHYGPVRSTMITALVPGLAAVGGVLFLGEPLSWNVVLGLAAVSIGIVFGVKPIQR
jgi:drug/metabolite transporter (DMT)-like permease